MQKNSNSKADIVFEHVSKKFPSTGRNGLLDASFTIPAGAFVSLVGPSGAGKTTALRTIAGLEKPTSGSVTVPEKVGLVFQNAALFPWLTALENVMFGLRMQGEPEVSARATAEKYLALLGLSEFASMYPKALSGGQRQRVGIARALAIEPPVLLLDEPFSALDEDVRKELCDDVVKIWQDTGITVVMISHQLDEAVALSQKIYLIKEYHVAATFDVDVPYPRTPNMPQIIDATEQVRAAYHTA